MYRNYSLFVRPATPATPSGSVRGLGDSVVVAPATLAIEVMPRASTTLTVVVVAGGGTAAARRSRRGGGGGERWARTQRLPAADGPSTLGCPRRCVDPPIYG